MSKRYLGICGNCGGQVVHRTAQHIDGPPMPPSCERCGAVPELHRARVLPMGPPRYKRGTAYAHKGPPARAWFSS